MKLKQWFAAFSLLMLAGAGCTTGNQTTGRGMMSTRSAPSAEVDPMREHCKIMPEMPGCEVYAEEGEETQPVTEDRSISGLGDALPQTDVYLQDGESYSLDASFVKKEVQGNVIRMLAYNREIPGPVLHVKQGDTVNIAFTNHLDEPTTVHWHGLRVENAYDGVPDMTQPPVNPGGSFTYRLKFPDAGLYWYHPHIREDYQQELGMYGLIWVEPSDTKTFEPVNRTALLALDDVLLSGGDVAAFEKERINHTLMGRFGNTMLVNGSTDYRTTVKNGDVVRFALVNTANTRVFKIAIPGARMKLVGGDSGGYFRDQWVESVTIAPSERVILDVRFSKSGTYRIRHIGPEIGYDLGTVTVEDAPTDQDLSSTFGTLQSRPEPFDGLATYYAKPVEKELDLTIEMPGMMGNMQMNDMMHQDTGSDGIEWEDAMGAMNARSNDLGLKWVIKDKATGQENNDIAYSFALGRKVKIRIYNDPHSMHPMQHPVHFHGNRFVVLAVNGVKNTNPVWKDTVLVPVGASVDILLDASNPGMWMAHCHIAEHLEDGMMFHYKVE